MISLALTVTLAPSSTKSLQFKSPLLPSTQFIRTHHKKNNFNQTTRLRNGTCRAELSNDAPFAVAIGACILNSLAFPIPSGDGVDDGDSVIDSSDARFAVMGIISFIPYFNWLTWVFALLDTRSRRYAVYAIVYLAPYLRTNLSLSPEESWLPIASIIFCIIHVQLEASIRNGDLEGFKLFNETAKHLSRKNNITTGNEERRKSKRNLPSSQEQSRNEIHGWGVPKKPSQDPELVNEEQETDEGRKH